MALMFRSTSLAFFTSGSSTRTESASAERVSSCDGVGISQPMTWQRGRSLGGIGDAKREEMGGEAFTCGSSIRPH